MKPAQQANRNRIYLPLIGDPLGTSLPKPAYVEPFNGNPNNPQSWQPTNWDVSIHTREFGNWTKMEPMQAMHGADCGAPPASHTITTLDEAVFICRNHMMTAINASGYGAIYLTPNQLVDFSSGEAVIRWDMSTIRTSNRDWVDLWITPYQDHLQLPLNDWLPDLSGEPRNAVHVQMDFSQNIFITNVVRNFQATELPRAVLQGYEQVLTPDAARRDTFEVRLSRTGIKVGMPAYNLWWVDTTYADLGWSQGVVQFGHHSYNPTKDCGSCTPNTWHWDNMTIAPAKPFTIIRANRRFADETAKQAVSFAGPAPANARLRFAGLGAQIEVSFDGGKTWQRAQKQVQEKIKEEHFQPYWMPIPAGTRQVLFRGQSWWGGSWHVRDISIWALLSP